MTRAQGPGTYFALILGLTFISGLFSGCGDDSMAPDSTPPDAIVDLVALAEIDSAATLTWTAPGDDRRDGTADRYEVRFSTTSPAIPEWWAEATPAITPPRPGPAGVQESWVVRDLSPDSSYTFAIRTFDEVGNDSGLSNLAEVDIVGPRPPAVADFGVVSTTSSWATLQWTHPAPGNATIEAYDLRVSPTALSEENWASALALEGLPGVHDPGSEREFLWTGLTANQTWFAGLRTRAPGGRLSQIESLTLTTPSLQIQTGSGPPRPVPDLSTALATAVDGDVIELGSGRFTGAGNRNLEVDKLTVTIRALNPGSAILDFEERGRGWVFRGGEARLEGLVLTRGRAGKGSNFGGAVFCFGSTSPEFEDCTFEENTAIASGGAVAVSGRATPTFVDCHFRNNEAEDDGGGIWIEGGSMPVLDRCTFTGNKAGRYGGGASFLSAGGQVQRSRFEINTASSGGAIALQSSSPTIDQTIFENNSAINDDDSAGSGGGAILARERSAPTIRRSTFARNKATDWGGAIYCWRSSSPIIERSVFSRNAAKNGGGILAWSGSIPTLDLCTFVANSAQFGGGVRAIGQGSGFQIRRSILALSTGGAAVHCQDGADVRLECSVIFNNRSGDWTVCIADQLGKNGNFRADPRFCDFERDDFRLRFDSPCIDREGCGTIGALAAGCTP